MKNTRLMRLLIAMLAAVMVLGCLLTSCSTSNNPGNETTGDQGNLPEDSTDTEEQEEDPYEALRGLDFGKKEFKVFTYPEATSGWAQYIVEHEGGVERLNSAAVERNGIVEELLNITITTEESVGGKAVISEFGVKAMGTAAEQPELLVPFATEKIVSLITGGYVYDVSKLDYVNLDGEAYNQSAKQNFNFKNYQYAFVSDLTYAVQQRFAFLANIDMIEEWGALELLDVKVDSFYELVTEGQLTVENVLKMIEGVYQDNGSEDPLAGTYGLVINRNSSARMFQDWGEPMVSLNDEGELVFSLYNTTIESKFSKMNDLVYSTYTYFDPDSNNYYKIFNQGNAMFSTYSSDPNKFTASPWKDVHMAYSPMPKYDAKDEYVTVSHGGLQMVPAKLEDPKMVGAAIEALAIASSIKMKDEYIQYYFETRVIQDPEGIELYEIIRESAYYDFARYVDPSGQLANVAYIYTPLMNKTALSTYHQNNGESIEKEFKDLFDQLGTPANQ